MTEDDFVRLFHHVMEKAEAFGKEMGKQFHPTFFELLFFMAVVFFLEKQKVGFFFSFLKRKHTYCDFKFSGEFQ